MFRTSMHMWRARGCVRRRATLLLALGGALGAALCVTVRVSVGLGDDAPLRARPAALARLLADFSAHARLLPHVGSWTIEREAGNYTSWRYAVAYECGARCAGRAEVAAHDHHAGGARHLAHGPPAEHRVRVALSECRRAPLLPWPAKCESWLAEWRVLGAPGGGAVVWASAQAACPLLRVLSGGCAADARARLASTLRLLAAAAEADDAPASVR